MGYPYAEATWDLADGAMFMGAGGSAPLDLHAGRDRSLRLGSVERQPQRARDV